MKGSTESQEQMDLKACRKTHQSSSSCLNSYIRQKGKGGQKTPPALRHRQLWCWQGFYPTRYCSVLEGISSYLTSGVWVTVDIWIDKKCGKSPSMTALKEIQRSQLKGRVLVATNSVLKDGDQRLERVFVLHREGKLLSGAKICAGAGSAQHVHKKRR